MQKHTFLFFLFLLVGLVACQKPAKKFSTSQYDPNAKNFSFLKETLKDVQILALGESSHGFGTLQTLKTDMIKYLNEELDFDILILQASYGDVFMSWHYKDESDDKQMINSFMPYALRSEQLLPLFTYLKEKSTTVDSMGLAGMDSQITGSSFNYMLKRIIRKLEPRVIRDSIQNGLSMYNKTFQFQDNQEQWQIHMDQFRSSLDLAKSILEDGREDILELEVASEEVVDALIRSLELLEAASDYNFGEAFSKGHAIRDSLMAENVSLIIKNNPGKKVIIWGHNGHIEKAPGEGDDVKWLGHYLKEIYGDKYYSMGMYAKKGYIFQMSEMKASVFDLSTTQFIEGKIDADYGKNVFIDMPLFDETNTNWVNRPIYGYELESGGQVNFVPSKRFDGVMLLGETEATRLLINQKSQRRG